MSATDERKTCIDCEYFDEHFGTVTGDFYGVCTVEGNIDGDGESALQLLSGRAEPCDMFKDRECDDVCRIVIKVTDGLTTDDPKRFFQLSCGHWVGMIGLYDVPRYCPTCGARVVE